MISTTSKQKGRPMRRIPIIPDPHMEESSRQIDAQECPSVGEIAKQLGVPLKEIMNSDSPDFSPYKDYESISLSPYTNFEDIDAGKLLVVFSAPKLWQFRFVMSNQKMLVLRMSILHCGDPKNLMNSLLELFLRLK